VGVTAVSQPPGNRNEKTKAMRKEKVLRRRKPPPANSHRRTRKGSRFPVRVWSPNLVRRRARPAYRGICILGGEGEGGVAMPSSLYE
jgi:hypothetical protein